MKNLDLTLDESERLYEVSRALSSHVRIRIMQLLCENSMNVVELAQKLGEPVSTVSNNVMILEQADLIRTERQSGVRGVMKLCSRKKDRVNIRLDKRNQRGMQSFFQVMPIGYYSDCRIEPVCGLVSDKAIIGSQDDPAVFFDPEHYTAQLLWLQQGYVEYRFSTRDLREGALKCLEVSFEACSEAPNYRKDWPSDITVWINDVELGTWHCPGDFGGRQGRNSPDWWPLSSTQYGMLKRWRVSEEGCELDEGYLSDVTLSQLHLQDQPYISLKIGIKPDAKQQGGMNLFGEGFGDYDQPIVLRLDCLRNNPPDELL